MACLAEWSGGCGRKCWRHLPMPCERRRTLNPGSPQKLTLPHGAGCVQLASQRSTRPHVTGGTDVQREKPNWVARQFAGGIWGDAAVRGPGGRGGILHGARLSGRMHCPPSASGSRRRLLHAPGLSGGMCRASGRWSRRWRTWCWRRARSWRWRARGRDRTSQSRRSGQPGRFSLRHILQPCCKESIS